MKRYSQEQPLVSIYCLSYNHEKYIKDTLEGILSQKVNFKYEVIIHDDASTDNSQEIIKEYADKYPDIIIPIFQTENQYSQGIKIFKNYILPRLRGRYTAPCECDDYWTDSNKLQKQVDLLEAREDVSICGHAFHVVDGDNKILGTCNRFGKGSGELPEYDVIMNEDLPQTATFMYRTELRKQMDEFFYNCTVGDYPLNLYMITKGKYYYIDEIMSCYRRHGNGSWVTRMMNNEGLFQKHLKSIAELFERYNEYTQGKYLDIIRMRQAKSDLMCLEREAKVLKYFSNPYFKTLSFKKKMVRVAKGCIALLKKVFSK